MECSVAPGFPNNIFNIRDVFYLGGGKTPSTGFCLLLRLLTLRCTTHQMALMLDHCDSPYIRAVGFLYLRYACDPTLVFQWIQTYLYDDEPIQIKAPKGSFGGSGRGGNASAGNTIGDFVRMIFSSRDYYGTMLPRLPVHLERDIQVQLLQAEKVQKRAMIHFQNKRTMEHFQKLGSEVMATYEDEENALTWYKAVVDRVVLRAEDGSPLKYPKFVVTFTEYGNTETVTLGEMDMPDGHFHKEDLKITDEGRQGRGYEGKKKNNSPGRRPRDDLYEEVRRRERDTVTSSRKGKYSSRPPTAKQMLSGRTGRSPSAEQKRSPSPRSQSRGAIPVGRKAEAARGHRVENSYENSSPRKRTAEELAAIQEKKRKLMAKYG